MNVLTIARFTIHEALSRRLVLAGLLIGLIFVGLFAYGFSFLYGQASDTTRGPLRPTIIAAHLTLMGLYTLNFLAGFLALFVSVAAISGEIDAGTLHAVLARPIRRSELIVGRWLAYVVLMSVYVALMAGLLLLAAYLIAGYLPPGPLPAVGLMILSSVLLLSVSLFGSTLLSTLANGVVVFTLFALAWLGGVIEFLGGVMDNDGMINLGIAVSLLVPSDGVWRAASTYLVASSSLLAAGPGLAFSAASPPATPFLVWAGLYPLVFLGAAILAFNRRDL